MAQLVENHDTRRTLFKILYFWSQNLVYFGALAPSLALPDRDVRGIDTLEQVVDHRIRLFRAFEDSELESEAEMLPTGWESVVSTVFESIGAASPLTVQTMFVSKWLLTHLCDGVDLRTAIGEPCWQLTNHVASKFDDASLCTGVSDLAFIQHFDYWKDTTWLTKDSITAIRQPNEKTVRSVSCNGFSDLKNKSLCSHCSAVRRHLQKEKSAYKSSPPGVKLLQCSLPPGYRHIYDLWKAGLSGTCTPSLCSSIPQTPSTNYSTASSSATVSPNPELDTQPTLSPYF